MTDEVRLIPKTREVVLRYLIEDPAAWRSMVQIGDATAITSGALYPTLAEMEQDVVVSSRDDPHPDSGGHVTGTRVYQLTPAGIAAARALPELSPASARKLQRSKILLQRSKILIQRSVMKSRRPKRKHRVLRVFLLGLLLVPGLIMCANQAVFQFNSATATATIVGYHSYHDAGKGSCPAHISYNVKASFTTTGGDSVTDVIGNLHYCAPLANGFTLPIQYDINDPSQAQSADGADNWGLPILVLVSGVLLLLGFNSYYSRSSSSQFGKWRSRAWRAAHGGPSL